MNKRDEREWFLDEWRTGVAPLAEASLRQAESANGFAQTVIRSSLLLNGGALIAVPAIVALFMPDTSQHQEPLLLVLRTFIAGLIAGWAAGFFAFFAVDAQSDSTYHDYEAAASRVHWLFASDAAQKDELRLKIDENKEAKAKYARKFVRARIAALSFSAASYILFCYGAIQGFSVVG